MLVHHLYYRRSYKRAHRVANAGEVVAQRAVPVPAVLLATGVTKGMEWAPFALLTNPRSGEKEEKKSRTR